MGAPRQTNTFTIAGQTAVLDVSTDKFPLARTCIDRSDLIRVVDGKGRWFAATRGHGVYVVRNKAMGDNETEALHGLIFGPAGRKLIDHEDGDTFNNRSGNLRAATRSQNGQNQKKQNGRSSRFKGVSRRKDMGKWCSRIRLRGRLIHLGYFRDERKAAMAYDGAAILLFKEFAKPNFP